MKTLIKVEHLHLGYDNQEVINDLSFDIQQGDFITVLGQNGAGTTWSYQTYGRTDHILYE